MDCSGARSSGLGSPVAPVPAAAGAAAEPAHGGGANAPSIAPVALMPASAGVVDAAALPAAPPPLRRRSRLLCRLDRKKSTTAGSRSKKSTHSLETIDEDVCRFRQPGVNQAVSACSSPRLRLAAARTASAAADASRRPQRWLPNRPARIGARSPLQEFSTEPMTSLSVFSRALGRREEERGRGVS